MGCLRGVLAVLGGVTANSAFGVLYSFGNMAPYIASYIRERSTPPNLRSKDVTILLAINLVALAGFMPIGGFLLKKIGPKLIVLIGGAIMSAAVIISYLAIESSFYMFLFTYGLIFGFGISIGYTGPLVCAMKWFPNNKGVVSGIITASFGLSVLIIAPIQTAYINPNNLIPNVTLPGDQTEKYFDDVGVLDRTRMSFVIFGVVYAALIIIGTLLISEPPKSDNDQETQAKDTESTMLINEKDKNNETALNRKNNQTSMIDTKGTGINLTTKEMIRTKEFWLLWLMFFFAIMVVIFINGLYKVFGQTFISDDTFLAAVGSATAVFNAVGKIFWGTIADIFSFRTAMLCLTSSVTIFMLTLMLVPAGGKWLFLFLVCAIVFGSGGIFALIPTVTSRAFGMEHIGINFACVMTSMALAGPVGALIPVILQDLIGWNGLFAVVSASSAIALVLAMVFNARRPTGEHI